MEIKEKQGEHPFGDTGQIIAFVIFLIIWLSDSFFLKFSTMWSDYVSIYIRLAIPAIILAISLYLLNASHKIVAGEHRPEMVVTDGVFKYLRHPLYMSALLFYMVFIFATFSLASFVFWIAIFIFYNYIAGYEEKIMEAKFGEDYALYKQKTGKWFLKL